MELELLKEVTSRVSMREVLASQSRLALQAYFVTKVQVSDGDAFAEDAEKFSNSNVMGLVSLLEEPSHGRDKLVNAFVKCGKGLLVPLDKVSENGEMACDQVVEFGIKEVNRSFGRAEFDKLLAQRSSTNS